MTQGPRRLISDSGNEAVWQPLKERHRQRVDKKSAVLRKAARLFLAQGYNRTSLNDVAEQLNITKPAVYNYFASKDELLFECFRLGHEMILRQMTEILDSPISGLEKVSRFIRAYARLMTTDYGACMVCLDERELPDTSLQKVRAFKRDIDSRLREFVSAGIRDGSIARCDVKLTTFAIAGSLNWIGHWYRPEGVSPDRIGEEFVACFIAGIAETRPLSKVHKVKSTKARRKEAR
jgi:AcrR family transcriptional regulator